MALAAPGDLDPSFGSGGKVLTDFGGSERASATALQPDGKIVAAGTADGDFALARYNADGSLDPTFGAAGRVVTDFGRGEAASAVALQPDGKIVVVGSTDASVGYDFALARYNTDGSLDASFGSGGTVLTDFGGSNFDWAAAVALQPDGKIVAAGSTYTSVRFRNYDFALARYNADGSLDASFGTGGRVVHDFEAGEDDEAYALALQPDGRIVAAGYSIVPFSTNFGLARYNTDGSLDTSFGRGGWVTTDFGDFFHSPVDYTYDSASAVALQRDGKIVTAGTSDVAGAHDFALVRYKTDGSLDASFGERGIVLTDFGGRGFDETASALAWLPNGKIVAAGTSDVAGGRDFALARYNFDGSLDNHFGSGGKLLTDFGASSFDWAAAVALQPDGKIVAAGVSGSDFALVRYLGEVPAPGAADLTVNKRDRPDPVIVGEVLSYVILVGNSGPQDAVDVTLQDVLPKSVAFLSARTRHGNCIESSRVVRCELGTLSAGDPTTVQIDVRPTQARRIRNSVTVYSGTYDPDTSNNVASARTTVVER